MKKRFLVLFLIMTVVLFVQNPEIMAADGVEKTAKPPLEGKYISVIGDSISTYMGWSDKYPITDEDYAHRYGEPYYGPAGSDCHNTTLSVEDTWWHQSAQELGAEILVSNAGNSTGLLFASYPDNADWQQYLQDMLVYKTRPYHLGVDGKVPDIIALYIGSNDAGKVRPENYGTVDAIDFETLIVANEDGTYTYAEPTTVAEAYCIMMHKIKVTYPNAEIYCFTVVPNSSGHIGTCNNRLKSVCPFNEMVKEVAAYHDAVVVDLYAAFGLDPDGDGVATQDDLNTFKTYFLGDPHPNAEGFDVISDCFTKAILENSDYVTEVETTAGNFEAVGVTRTETETHIQRSAEGFVTESGMVVDYWSKESLNAASQELFFEKYTAVNAEGTYKAEGGSQVTVEYSSPQLGLSIPLTDTDNAETEKNETLNRVKTETEGLIETTDDPRDGDGDGVYDYTDISIYHQGVLTVQTRSVSVEETITDKTHENMRYLRSTTVPSADKNMLVGIDPVQVPESPEDVPPILDGYGYVYIGSDQLSNFWAAYVFDHPDMTGFPDETPIYSDDDISLYAHADHSIFTKRKLVVPNMFLPGKTVEGTYPARYDSIQQFTLCSENGQVFTAYCADQNTPAERGYSYRIVNLEDSTYYTGAEADMLYTVASHGYWGTESGLGSLASVKQMMSDSGQFTEEEVAKLNDGMAMTATQYAVWTFSNKMDGKVFTNAYFTTKSGAPSSVGDQDSVALIFKLYHYLISLPPETPNEIDPTTRNTIINEKNFLDSVFINVIEKPMEDPQNKDADTGNDVYNVDLSFKLKVTPSTENGDDLALYIIDEETNEVQAIGRIAGELRENEVQLEQNDDGKWVFHDIMLEEGLENISFHLSGTQYLGMTPYLFTSEVNDGVSSQTMVAFAGGSHGVNVRMSLGFDLDVKDDVLLLSHQWRTEEEIPLPPDEDPDDPNEDPDDPNEDPDDPNEDPDDPDGTSGDKDPDKDSSKDNGKNNTNGNGSSSDKTDGKGSAGPQTGDETDISIWFALLLISGYALWRSIMRLRRN